MRRCWFLIVGLIIFAAVAVAQPKDDDQQAQTALNSGEKVSTALATVTSTAISPLVGVCVIGAWQYYHTPKTQRDHLPLIQKPKFWIPVIILLAHHLHKRHLWGIRTAHQETARRSGGSVCQSRGPGADCLSLCVGAGFARHGLYLLERTHGLPFQRAGGLCCHRPNEWRAPCVQRCDGGPVHGRRHSRHVCCVAGGTRLRRLRHDQSISIPRFSIEGGTEYDLRNSRDHCVAQSQTRSAALARSHRRQLPLVRVGLTAGVFRDRLRMESAACLGDARTGKADSRRESTGIYRPYWQAAAADVWALIPRRGWNSSILLPPVIAGAAERHQGRPIRRFCCRSRCVLPDRA